MSNQHPNDKNFSSMKSSAKKSVGFLPTHQTPWKLPEDHIPWNLPNVKNTLEISGKKLNGWQQKPSSQSKKQNIGKTEGDRGFYDQNDKNSLWTSSSSQRNQRNIGKTKGATRLYKPNDKNSSSIKFSIGVSHRSYNKPWNKKSNHTYHKNRWNTG